MADDEILTEHFILVRVKHTAEQDAKRFTPVMAIRQAIHDAAATYDINESDLIFHPVQYSDYFGRPVIRDYLAVQEIVNRTLREIKAKIADRPPRRRTSIVTGKPLPQRDPKEKAKTQHRARARRALLVVRDYEQTYGEELKVN